MVLSDGSRLTGCFYAYFIEGKDKEEVIEKIKEQFGNNKYVAIDLMVVKSDAVDYFVVVENVMENPPDSLNTKLN
jgi:hypothetical protein